MANHKDIFIEHARAFSREYGAVAAQLESLLEFEAYEQAAAQMHTMKGVAATLGAVSLADMAAALESALKAGTPSPVSADDIQALRSSVAEAEQALSCEAERLANADT